MATLTELYGIIQSPGNLLGKIAGACLVKADAIVNEAIPNAERRAWATTAFQDPQAKAQELLGALIGASAAFTVAQITNADDASIQAAVNAAVDALIPTS